MKKICSKCKQEKELLEFYKEKKYLDGRRSDCKVCVIKRNHLYKLKTKEWKSEKSKARKRSYYYKNKEKCREYYKRNNRKLRKNLYDSYIKNLICHKSTLQHKDIPENIIQIHRFNLILKRLKWRKQKCPM